VATRHPETEEVFEWYDISVEDYADATLGEVAEELDIELETLLDDLEDALPSDDDEEEEDDDEDDLGPLDDDEDRPHDEEDDAGEGDDLLGYGDDETLLDGSEDDGEEDGDED